MCHLISTQDLMSTQDAMGNTVGIWCPRCGGYHFSPYVPKTDFGRKLMALRAQGIARGMRLLTEDEIRAEVLSRRGESDG